jgi:plasmid stabilization system protein ParE
VKVRFLPEAEDELDEAVASYNKAAPGLGAGFAFEVREGLRRVLEFPEAWPQIGTRVRRYRLRRFPYGIVYAALPSEIAVVAIMHLHRRPGYWKQRLGEV